MEQIIKDEINKRISKFIEYELLKNLIMNRGFSKDEVMDGIHGYLESGLLEVKLVADIVCIKLK